MLVVDVRKRITVRINSSGASLIADLLRQMSEILAHPFFSRDTPGIYYIPPPSVSALHAPIVSIDDIDQDLLSSLRIIFGKHASRAVISHELVQDAPNCAKAFYVLLLKFRDRQMENFNGDRDDATDNRTGPHPYQSPRIQPVDYPSVTRTISPPSPAATRDVVRPTHARTQSSPTRNRSSPVGMGSRLPTVSGTRAPYLPLPIAPVSHYATATSSSRSGDSASPSLRPPSTPVPAILGSPAQPYQSTAPTIPPPSARRRDTTPAATAGLGLGIAAPILPVTSGITVRSNGRRRDTSPSGPRPALGLGITGPVESATSESYVRDRAAKVNAPASPRVRRATSPAPPPLLAPVSLSVPSPAIPRTSAEEYVPLPSQRMCNPETQLVMDALVSQANVLGARDNAARQQQLSPPIVQEFQKSLRGDGQARYSYRHSNHSHERAGYLSVTEKENTSPKSTRRSRAGSEGTKRTQGTAKPPSVYGQSNYSHDRAGYLPIAEENATGGDKSVKRGRAGSEGTRSAQAAFKKGIIRKSRRASSFLLNALRLCSPDLF